MKPIHFQQILALIVGLTATTVTPLGAQINAIWANTGEDKVTRSELRASQGKTVLNSVWDGSKISIFGARNEVVAFNLILEVPLVAARHITISFKRLNGPQGNSIHSVPTSGNGVFDWTERPIELFFIRYLRIKGLSKVSYEVYDERHIPQRFRQPTIWKGKGVGGWSSRPDHNQDYPEIAVPLEVVPEFDIPARSNQSIWVDIYIPKDAVSGRYTGEITIQENGKPVRQIPVQLRVYGFTLPDTPSAKTMLYYSSPNINHRYLGSSYIKSGTPEGSKAVRIRDRHYLLAHRHRFSLIGDSPEDCEALPDADHPCPETTQRLNGGLFTNAKGYAGPGVNVGNNVYSIGTYGAWGWRKGTASDMTRHMDAWAVWFQHNAPSTEYFLYLIDESSDTAQIESWSRWIADNPGPGRQVRSLATLPLPLAAAKTPSLDIPMATLGVGSASVWQPLADRYTSDSRKRLYMYNGSRPATGSTAIEDDGVALRQRGWAQYKKKINRWFYWETTYYNNYQGGGGETNVFQTAHTFGAKTSVDFKQGETGWNYSNGDGVLFYPGTDRLYQTDSYGIEGPLASLRLKYWRRGLQDVDYLTMAAAINPVAVQMLVNRLVPKVLWEYDVDNERDPTYVHTDISWPIDPDVWEDARARLAEIIEQGNLK